ncbi:lengsin-like [Amphiura filiformis]|uniref:lengsin-like n=1 Tax=Amphiura filiformis TaxID=82378 RepID=UPI003B21FB78
MDSNNKLDQLAAVMKRINEDKVKFIRFEQTDIYSVARSKTIPAKYFCEKVIKGLPFFLGHLGMDVQGNQVEGTAYCAAVGYADALTFPDLNTYTTIPWCKNTGRILIEPTYLGKPVDAHPRTLAQSQLLRLKETGFSLYSAHEHEFYLAHRNTLEPYTSGYNCKATIRNYQDPDVLHDFLSYLPEVGVDIETYCSEYGPGQMEITYKPAFGITSADIAHTFRTSVKEIALQHGYIASFMSKPYPLNSGSSCHFNHSLWDLKGEQSMMHDKGDPAALSDIAKNWIAGLVAHAPAVAVLMAPTINCLKRFQVDSLAPVNASWGYDNRTAAIRVKVAEEGDI